MEIYEEFLEKLQKFLQLAVEKLEPADKELFMAKADLKDFELNGFLKYKPHVSDLSRRSYGDMVEHVEHDVEIAFARISESSGIQASNVIDNIQMSTGGDT